MEKKMSKLQELRDSLVSINVLYVEDEDDLRKETFLFLKKIFANIDSASNGEEGLTLFKEKGYDLVISDLKMPKMNGREMLKLIHEINKNTSIIVMTASDSNIDASQTICDAYMNKPVVFTDFIEVIRTLQPKLLSNVREESSL